MLAIATALVVVLGVDPVMFGSAWSGTAQANPQNLISESREQNYDTASTALGLDGPAESAALIHDVPDADPQLDPLVLPGELPAADSTEVDVLSAEQTPGEPATVQLGGMDVSVAPVTDGSSPERVELTVLDQTQTEEQGVTGVLLQVADASTTPPAGDEEVTLAVSYETFAGVAGGDWASRLQAVWVPECDAGTDPADCRPVPLASQVDEAAQTVTVDVPVLAATDGGAAPAMLTGTTAAAATVSSTESPRGGVAITSGVAGPLGDWSATGLALSSTWGTTGATGAFTWAYPMRVPQVPAGPAPEVGLSYNSAVSDGRIPSTNNQSGLIGEGFDIGASFIERSYKSCAEDETTGANNIDLSAPDLCWGKENATLSLNGSSVELIKDKDEDGGIWHPKHDDGTRIEHLASGGAKGEHWKVTTTDGTQYFFGLHAEANSAWTVPVYGNHDREPGHAATFAESKQTQVWRWNLDRVIDPSGNTASYFYTAETNRYRPFYDDAQIEYVSGGYLKRIEYGTHADDGVTQAPAKVEFAHTPRCITDLAVPDSWCSSAQSSTNDFHWPDTPVDLICTSGAECTTYAPTFFNRTRLATVTTSANIGTSYQPVDTWQLTQRFVAQGDGIGLEYATGIMLRLDSVIHTGNGGSRTDLTLPALRFDYGAAMKNRVVVADTGADGLSRHRVRSIRTESGGKIAVNYSPECATIPANQADNHTLCFPVKWHRPGEPNPRTDWFTKYVVTSIVEGHTNADTPGDELINGSATVTTSYDYANADWKWVKPDTPLIDDTDKTYSEFRGAREVTTTTGHAPDQPTKTITTYYRGTGDSLPHPFDDTTPVKDWDRLAGEIFTTVQTNGDDVNVTATATTYGDPVTVATSELDAAYTSARIPSQTVQTRTYDANGNKEFDTRTSTEFNAYSQPTAVNDEGEIGLAADDLCTTTTYAHETHPTLADKHLVALPAAVETVAKACGQQPDRPEDVVTAAKISYDTSGRPTTTETIDPNDGDGYIHASTSAYDTRGRVTETADAAGQITSTGYTHTAGGLVAETTTTNPLGYTTTTRFDPILGVPVASTDANGRTTTAEYDALGRRISVTYPQHTGKKSVEYEYTVKANGLNAVVTKSLSADGQRHHANAVIYDGLLRPFQTQEAGRGKGTDQAGPGRTVTHTVYDSAGRVKQQTEPWWVTGHASATPEVAPADTSGQTTFEYDAAGRQTAQIFWIGPTSNPANEQWRTTTDYNGAATLQIPPLGGVPTETKVDPRGRTVQLTQYQRDPDDSQATAPADVRQLPAVETRYSYDVAGRLTGMIDAEDNEWAYSYDWAGRQISASDPDAGNSTSTYDVLGRVATRTNANGQTLGYTYDPLGRTTSIRDDSPTGAIRAEWEYDTVHKGVLTAATRYEDGQEYVTRTDEWDAAYRPTQTTLELPNTGPFTHLQTRTLITELEYTVDGQTAAVTYPAVGHANGETVLGQEKVTTVYDTASSMPAWMSGGFGWGTYVAYSRFDSAGRPLLTDLGNTYGAVASYQYDDGTKRLSGISLDRERINGTELDLTYEYDPAGNVTSITDTPTNTALSGAQFHDNQCFSYDGLARLQTAWTPGNGNCGDTPTAGTMGGAAPYWTNYSYDVLGNRTKQTTTQPDGTQETTTYLHEGDGPHAVSATITAGQTTAYTYDAAGNRTSTAVQDGPTTEYTWDAEGELVTAGDTSNVYDADGNRIIRTDVNGTTVYAGGQEIHIGTDGDVSATRYYSFAGKMVAIRTDRGLGDGVTSIITDHHGTPIAAIPNGGHPHTTPINRLYTDPFGATRGTSDADTVPGDSQFLGKTRDAATGLTQVGARYYDEVVGAFIRVDPILDLTDPQQWNAYAYANNTPVTMSDPSGLRPDDLTGAQWNTYKRTGDIPTTVSESGADGSAGGTVVPPVRPQSAGGGGGGTADRPKPDLGLGGGVPSCGGSMSFNQGQCPEGASGAPSRELPCDSFSFNKCDAGTNVGAVYCASAGGAAVIASMSGTTCSVVMPDGSRVAIAGADVGIGFSMKMAAEAGVGVGWTNAQTPDDLSSLTWSASMSANYGAGAKGVGAYGSSPSGRDVWMFVLYGQAGIGGGLSMAGGGSCRMGDTC